MEWEPDGCGIYINDIGLTGEAVVGVDCQVVEGYLGGFIKHVVAFFRNGHGTHRLLAGRHNHVCPINDELVGFAVIAGTTLTVDVTMDLFDGRRRETEGG